MAATNTTWKFNPPYGPHFGGIRERLIQTAKRTLLFILGSRRLSLGVFRKNLVETEAILNSKPLTIVADLPENEMPLTPNHFLINRPFNSLPPGKFDSQDPASFKSWKNVQQMVYHFWKRIVKEYLPTLLKKFNWSNSDQTPLRVNDIVWLLKDMTPRGICPLGRVLKVYPGQDGQHRVVKVKTAYGTYVRPRTCLGWLAHFFLTFFRSGSLGNLGCTLFVDLVKCLWCVSWPPLSPGACCATIKSEVKLEKTLTFVLIVTKNELVVPATYNWLKKLCKLSRTM